MRPGSGAACARFELGDALRAALVAAHTLERHTPAQAEVAAQVERSGLGQPPGPRAGRGRASPSVSSLPGRRGRRAPAGSDARRQSGAASVGAVKGVQLLPENLVLTCCVGALLTAHALSMSLPAFALFEHRRTQSQRSEAGQGGAALAGRRQRLERGRHTPPARRPLACARPCELAGEHGAGTAFAQLMTICRRTAAFRPLSGSCTACGRRRGRAGHARGSPSGDSRSGRRRGQMGASVGATAPVRGQYVPIGEPAPSSSLT
jgi:hypothetical protein